VRETDSLHELIKMIGNGDRTAFEELYTRMHQPLYKKLMYQSRYAITKEDAEDIVQNTFVKINLYASRYNGLYTEASARSWMYTIAFHEAERIVKLNRKFVNSIDDDDSDDGLPAVPGGSRRKSGLIQEGRQSVEEHVERSILFDSISSNIQWLAVEERNMLTLRFDSDLTFEQIGREIGRSKPRAKQVVDGVLAKIRKAIGADGSRR
jgi:RNA polymerase sigma factor (sigma-70 family)